MGKGQKSGDHGNANRQAAQADAAVFGFLDILTRRLRHELVFRAVCTGVAGGMVAVSLALLLGGSWWWGAPGFIVIRPVCAVIVVASASVLTALRIPELGD